MSYTCPDCTDGVLEAKVREVDLELKDGEAAQIVGGVVLVTSVACNNGCSADDEVEEEKPKKRKKRKPNAEAGVAATRCTRADDCTRGYAHTGLCNHKGNPDA